MIDYEINLYWECDSVCMHDKGGKKICEIALGEDGRYLPIEHVC